MMRRLFWLTCLALFAAALPANAQNRLAQKRFAYFGLAPHGSDEFIVPDGAIVMLDQVGQAVEHLRRQRDQPVAAPELAQRRKDAKLAKTITAIHLLKLTVRTVCKPCYEPHVRATR